MSQGTFGNSLSNGGGTYYASSNEMLYEIHLPGVGGQSPRIVQVHGENWLDALRRGVGAAGLPAPTRNLACDLQDDESVIATDTDTGMVFRVAPVQGSRSAGPLTVGPVEARATRLSSRPPDPNELADPFEEEDALSQRRDPPSRDSLPALRRSQDAVAASPRATAPMGGSDLARRWDLLQRELTELDQLGRDIHDACNFTLDVIRASVACGAGSVLLIDVRDRCLYFAATRGPKAAVVASQRIPIEVGIAGASIRERQVLNIRDPGRDPRFAASFADSIGYHPRSLVCAPIMAGNKAFGVIQLLDRDARDEFPDDDAELVLNTARRLGSHFLSLLPPKA